MKDNKKIQPEMPPTDIPEKIRQDTVWERITKYGTYQVQDTNNTENEYPAIAQGLPENMKNVQEDQKT